MKWLSVQPDRSSARGRFPRLLAALATLLLSQADGQTPDHVIDPLVEARQRVRTVIAREDVSGGGVFHYVIFREPTAEESTAANWTLERNVISRGEMGYDGISRVILAPETRYFMYALYADSLMFGSASFRTPRAGETFTIPRMGFFDLEDDDSDGDGLSDIREFVIGTDEFNPDSDGDEVNDAAEVQQGSNPLDGFVATTGIIATAPMPGEAYDVIASNNIAIVSARTTGVSIFNIESSRAPTRIAQIDTPGDALLSATFGTYVAVADGAAGLTVIDISDPPESSILYSFNIGQNATAVATYGTIAFVGGANGIIVAVDMISGSEIDRYRSLTGRIWNLAVRGDYLYALRSGTLSVFLIEDGSLTFVRNVSAPGSVGAGQRPLRLYVAENQLITVFYNGINVFSLSDPSNPSLIKRHTTAQAGWKQIALNGNGQAVATVSPNSTNDGPHHLSLYSLSEDGNTMSFATEFETPGLAASVAIFNGRAYVADSAAGLQVVNYIAFDRFGQAPTIELQTDAVEGAFEEGKLMDIRAIARDDVQVRNVQFYVNGQISQTDGNYPFGYRLLTPLIAQGQASFTLHAVATDTGGNMTTSETLTIELVPDITPPRVKSTLPRNAAFTGELSGVTAVMSEVIDIATLTDESFAVTEAGADELFDTADDQTINGSLSFDELTNRISWNSGSLPNGYYRVSIQSPLADLAGNVLEDPFTSVFRVLGYVDSDNDGLPDYWELEHGLDPFNPDSNNNGIPDGEEDPDRDNLPNIGEFLLDRNPAVADSDGDGIKDGDYDEDLDGLSDGLEFLHGTDPFKVDTDGDGISDADEIAEGTNPLEPSSLPPTTVASHLASYLNAEPVPTSPLEDLFTVASKPASFLNALPASTDEEVLYSLATPPASYLNALMLPDDSGLSIAISPEVSYEATAD